MLARAEGTYSSNWRRSRVGMCWRLGDALAVHEPAGYGLTYRLIERRRVHVAIAQRQSLGLVRMTLLAGVVVQLERALVAALRLRAMQQRHRYILSQVSR